MLLPTGWPHTAFKSKAAELAGLGLVQITTVAVRADMILVHRVPVMQLHTLQQSKKNGKSIGGGLGCDSVLAGRKSPRSVRSLPAAAML